MLGVEVTVPGEPNDDMWEAVLYDWHNEHRLRRQRADIPYWLVTTTRATCLLVLGAGTGRVATALARSGQRHVTAVDASAARLRRLPRSSALTAVCGDLRSLPLSGGFDTAVVPYSTFQLLRSLADRRAALSEAARVLAPNGMLHIDVSSSFDSRTAVDWHLALAAHCEPAGVTVEEWERRLVETDHLVIDKSFRVGDCVLVALRERWTHLKSLDLPTELERAGFAVTGIDRGYGHGSAPHRLIYHGRRTPPSRGDLG
ncbi:MAG: class I SAM-dependent methyltransferase [Pseudonocardiaceae bacterium]